MKFMGWWLAVCLLGLAACTKHNPAVCCSTEAECSAIGFEHEAACAAGLVCSDYACAAPCNGECAGNTPFCAEDHKTCIGCFNASQCGLAAPFCDADTRSCRGCVADSECESNICDFTNNSCFPISNLLYASPDGSVIDDCSMASPCKFEEALAAVAGARSTIILAPGMYNPEPFDRTVPITIVGYQATIERFGSWEVDPGVDLTLKGLTFETDGAQADTLSIECAGSTTIPTKMKLIDVKATAGFAAEHCDATFLRSRFDFIDDAGGDVAIEQSTINSQLTVEPSPTKLSVVNSVVGKLTFSSSSTSAQVDISFTTIVSGVTAPANLSGVKISNSIIGSGGQANAVVCSAPCALNVSNNLLSAQSTAIPGNLVGDPLFVNPASDFHLKVGSPAVDKANASGPATDRDGTTRPSGAAADLGAYELLQ